MGRYFNIIVISILLFILVGCRNGPPLDEQRPNWYSYNNQSVGYTLKVPIIALVSWKEKKPIDAPKMGFGTYPILTQPQVNDYDISITQLSNPCTPSTTGASQTTPLNDGIMGKVDYFDGGTYIYKVGPAPLCSPPQDYENRKDMHPTAYAFCSQKEEKTVLICISQMTDNPKLAEEIFSTFRWIK